MKVRVCHALAAVVVASVSTDLVPSAASSTFKRTGIPAAGAYTRRVIDLAVEVNGIVAIELFAPVLNVVPAHVSATADLITFATLLVPTAGSVATVESSAPPKPANV